MATANQEQCAAALTESRKQEILGIPGVTGVGIGLKIKDNVITNIPCIVVCVLEKKADIAHEQKIPETYLLATGIKVPTDVVQTGLISINF